MNALDKLWRWRENFSVTSSSNVLQTWEEINVKEDDYSVGEDVYQDFLVKPHWVKIMYVLKYFKHIGYHLVYVVLKTCLMFIRFLVKS